MVDALRASLARLGVDRVDLYQVRLAACHHFGIICYALLHGQVFAPMLSRTLMAGAGSVTVLLMR